jgi:hypothetical protein
LRGATLGGTSFWDNATVRELPGNHATQSTTASQPIYGIVPAGGRRNILTFTEQFDVTTGGWAKNNATVTANAVVAPDGTTTADKLIENTATSVHYLVNAIPINGVYTFSVFAKAGERNAINIWSDSPSLGIAYFDLANGTRTFTAGSQLASAAIEPIGTDGWYRCSITTPNLNKLVYFVMGLGNPLTYAGNGTSGAYLWGAQLELGSTATPYQRVTTQYDVTEAGVASLGYLYFDGGSDSMVTSTITPGIDKAQVFAGVRKVSDATRGVVAELSATVVNPGTFVVYAPSGTATPAYLFGSVGTSAGIATSPSSYAAPITNVLTGIGDISGDSAALRIDGTQVAQSTADQGTGNFLAYPLYIGARGGTTLEFQGHLYSLLVRFGPNLTDARISATESWVASKTAGVTL